MNASFDKLREKTNASIAKANQANLGSISSTAEALALSPAAKRMSNSSTNSGGGGRQSVGGRNSQTLNANQILTAVQSNAQKFGKRLNSAFSSSPKNPIRLIEAQNKNPISVYAGVVVTSSRSSRRRYFFFSSINHIFKRIYIVLKFRSLYFALNQKRISSSDAMRAFAVATSGMGSQTSLVTMDSGNKSVPQVTSTTLARQSVDICKNPFNAHHRVDRVNSAGNKSSY